jgi:hypothetical protein
LKLGTGALYLTLREWGLAVSPTELRTVARSWPAPLRFSVRSHPDRVGTLGTDPAQLKSRLAELQSAPTSDNDSHLKGSSF